MAELNWQKKELTRKEANEQTGIQDRSQEMRGYQEGKRHQEEPRSQDG